MARKTPAQLAAETIALLDLSRATKVNVEELRDLLIDGFSNLKGPIHYDEVDDFITGDNDLKSAVTTGMSAGHLIAVIINGIIHHYVLEETAAAADISPYLIKPDDYVGGTPKIWKMANCKYFEIDDGDLGESHEYCYKHDAGIKYPGAVICFNNTDEIVPPVVVAGLSGETNYNGVATNVDNFTVKFAGAITGTWKFILVF